MANPETVVEHLVGQLLLQIALILVVARLCGWALNRLGQPRVIGEMLAGILLGPTLLGQIDGGRWMQWVFTPDTRPSLEMLSQIGVVLFMFLVGLELDLAHVVKQGKAVVLTAAASMIVPFALGIALALWMAQHGFATGPHRAGFVIFMATALCITAFPVLARILSEARLQRTPMGMVAIACAAMNDVAGWCILAVVLALLKAGGEMAQVWRTAATTIGLTAAYVAFMVLVLRPLVLRPLVRHARGAAPSESLATLFILLTLSALVTDWIGVHAVFGAFMLGAVIPASAASPGEPSGFVEDVTTRIEDIATLFLLPLFFAHTGLHTNLALLSDASTWAMAAIITGMATLGKVGGTLLAARLTTLDARHRLALGILMNTRGLMELIILNVGLEVGVIDERVFSMMVLMTLVTTLMTAPLVRSLAAGHWVGPFRAVKAK